MEIRFGSMVVSNEAEELGSLLRLVVASETRQVAGLVIEHGPFGSGEVVAPIGVVADADEHGVRLELSPEQFVKLPNFAVDRNLAPPPDVRNIDENQVTDPVDVADVPPVGAATGVESIAFTPIEQETLQMSAADQIIDAQTEVWATDGQIGHLHKVGVNDDTERISNLTVAKGFLFHHDVLVPAEAIASIQPGRVVLNLERSSFRAAPDD